MSGRGACPDTCHKAEPVRFESSKIWPSGATQKLPDLMSAWRIGFQSIGDGVEGKHRSPVAEQRTAKRLSNSDPDRTTAFQRLRHRLGERSRRRKSRLTSEPCGCAPTGDRCAS